MSIPIHLIGLSLGVKDMGGIMDQTQHVVELEISPVTAPDFIDYDVTHLALNEKAHISELAIPVSASGQRCS
jgi:hypothetical protein